jgi:hypothetical protein
VFVLSDEVSQGYIAASTELYFLKPDVQGCSGLFPQQIFEITHSIKKHA